MNFLVDTHALLWYFTDSPTLSQKAKEIFEKSEQGKCVIFVPSIVIAECLSIFCKKKITFDFESIFKSIKKSANYTIIPPGSQGFTYND